MKKILVLTTIAVLGGFGAALAGEQGRDDMRATQEHAIKSDKATDDAGKAHAEATEQDMDADKQTRAHDEVREDRDSHRDRD